MLIERIEKGQVEGIYLIYGQEKYLINYWINQIISTALNENEKMMNLHIIEKISKEDIFNTILTPPFMAKYRVVLLKNSDLMLIKDEKFKKKFLEILKDIPRQLVLIIEEEGIDKRSAIYKAVNKFGLVSEFTYLDEQSIIRFIVKELAKNEVSITRKAAESLIQRVGFDLYQISEECNKLSAYARDTKEIRDDQIKKLVTERTEAKVFDMVDHIAMNNKKEALAKYKELIRQKEPPMKLLYLMSGQFLNLYDVKKMLEYKLTSQEIAANIKLPNFVINKLIRQANAFSLEKIEEFLRACIDIELKMKKGQQDLIEGTELLLMGFYGQVNEPIL